MKKSQEDMKKLQKDSVVTNSKLLKVQRSQAEDAKFLGRPHLLNLANKILMLCKGRKKPTQQKIRLSPYKGIGRRSSNIWLLLSSCLNLKKAKSNASMAALSQTRPKEWATAFDSINENRNLGIHCDTWTEIDRRANEACNFLKKHQYLYRSCAMEVFIISNRNVFKTHSCE